MAALKAQLLGDESTPLDRVLAGAVVIAHLAHHRSARLAAKSSAMPGMAGVRDRNLTAAQKRLLAAIRGWRLIQQVKAKVGKPKGKLKLFREDEVA